MTLRPFFSFFGAKWGLSRHYPAPEHDTIVEPFAGSAGYATRYAERKVVLVERDPVIAAMWRYLVAVETSEVLGLPLDVSSGVDALDCCQEARWLIGFWVARGVTAPRKHATSWMQSGRWPSSFWGERIRARIARQVDNIRHWRVIEGDYSAAPNIAATWMIDPPYVEEGYHYKHHDIDYVALASWILARQGLVIASEATGADWLPFAPFRDIKSLARSTARESLFIQRAA